MEGIARQIAQGIDETAPAGPGQSPLDHGREPVGSSVELASGDAGYASAAPTPTLIPAGALEVVTLLHVCQCGVCGIIYALPLATHAQRVEQSAAIFCPSGHSNAPTPIGSDGTPAGMTMDLQQLRFENLQLRRAVAKFGPAPITKKELGRRATILSEQQETLQYGQVLCPFCGNRKRSRHALRNHMYRQHEGDLRIEPEERFRI